MLLLVYASSKQTLQWPCFQVSTKPFSPLTTVQLFFLKHLQCAKMLKLKVIKNWMIGSLENEASMACPVSSDRLAGHGAWNKAVRI